MATSANGWPVHNDQTQLTVIPWLTGRVLGGDVWTIFNYLFTRFHNEVEPIDRSASWGWAKRPIRGSVTTISNHASATAGDVNADRHWLGARGTFTPAQVRTIKDILVFLEGVVEWGGNYRKRADEMHFEINVGPSHPGVARVAAKIRALPIEKEEEFMSEAAEKKLDYVQDQLKSIAEQLLDGKTGKIPYMSAQLRAIAESTYSADAIKAQTARTAKLVGDIVAAQTKGLTDTIAKASRDGGISAEALDQIQSRVADGVRLAIDNARREAEAAAPALTLGGGV